MALELVYFKPMITAQQVDAARVDVEHQLASVCGVLNQSYARLVALVTQALADESWAIGGVRCPEHWLTMRAGLCPFHRLQRHRQSCRKSGVEAGATAVERAQVAGPARSSVKLRACHRHCTFERHTRYTALGSKPPMPERDDGRRY